MTIESDVIMTSFPKITFDSALSNLDITYEGIFPFPLPEDFPAKLSNIRLKSVFFNNTNVTLKTGSTRSKILAEAGDQNQQFEITSSFTKFDFIGVGKTLNLNFSNSFDYTLTIEVHENATVNIHDSSRCDLKLYPYVDVNFEVDKIQTSLICYFGLIAGEYPTIHTKQHKFSTTITPKITYRYLPAFDKGKILPIFPEPFTSMPGYCDSISVYTAVDYEEFNATEENIALKFKLFLYTPKDEHENETSWVDFKLAAKWAILDSTKTTGEIVTIDEEIKGIAVKNYTDMEKFNVSSIYFAESGYFPESSYYSWGTPTVAGKDISVVITIPSSFSSIETRGSLTLNITKISSIEVKQGQCVIDNDVEIDSIKVYGNLTFKKSLKASSMGIYPTVGRQSLVTFTTKPAAPFSVNVQLTDFENPTKSPLKEMIVMSGPLPDFNDEKKVTISTYEAYYGIHRFNISLKEKKADAIIVKIQRVVEPESVEKLCYNPNYVANVCPSGYTIAKYSFSYKLYHNLYLVENISVGAEYLSSNLVIEGGKEGSPVTINIEDSVPYFSEIGVKGYVLLNDIKSYRFTLLENAFATLTNCEFTAIDSYYQNSVSYFVTDPKATYISTVYSFTKPTSIIFHVAPVTAPNVYIYQNYNNYEQPIIGKLEQPLIAIDNLESKAAFFTAVTKNIYLQNSIIYNDLLLNGTIEQVEADNKCKLGSTKIAGLQLTTANISEELETKDVCYKPKNSSVVCPEGTLEITNTQYLKNLKHLNVQTDITLETSQLNETIEVNAPTTAENISTLTINGNVTSLQVKGVVVIAKATISNLTIKANTNLTLDSTVNFAGDTVIDFEYDPSVKNIINASRGLILNSITKINFKFNKNKKAKNSGKTAIGFFSSDADSIKTAIENAASLEKEIEFNKHYWKPLFSITQPMLTEAPTYYEAAVTFKDEGATIMRVLVPIIIVVVVILVLAGIAYAVWFFILKKRNEKNDSSTFTQPMI